MSTERSTPSVLLDTCDECAKNNVGPCPHVMCPCGGHGPCANPNCHVRTGRLPGGGFASHRFNNDLRYGDGDHPRQWHLTPEYVLERVRTDLGIGQRIALDPCTFADNPTDAEVFFTANDDGLAQSWEGARSIFVNPPYGKAREPWVEKCIAAGARGQRTILLIPAATDTRTFQKAASTSTALVFVRGRVKFGTRRENRRQHAASHPSALIGWNTDLTACSELGLRVVAS